MLQNAKMPLKPSESVALSAILELGGNKNCPNLQYTRLGRAQNMCITIKSPFYSDVLSRVLQRKRMLLKPPDSIVRIKLIKKCVNKQYNQLERARNTGITKSLLSILTF